MGRPIARPLAWILAVAASGGVQGQLLDPNPWRPNRGPDEIPRIVFDSLEHDFGRISDQWEVRHRFGFTNMGKGTLAFRPSHRSGTGGDQLPRSLKSPDTPQPQLAPGEKGFFELYFNSHGKRGAVRQQFTVQCNDPNHDPEGPVLVLRAFVRPSITFEPAAARFGDVESGEIAKQVVLVTGDRTDFAVTYVSTTKGRFITCKILKNEVVERDGERVGQTLVELTLNAAGLSPETFNACGTVRTTHPDCWLADFAIQARIVPPETPPRTARTDRSACTVFKKTRAQ